MNSRVVSAIAAAVLAVLGIGAAVFYAAGANARAFDGATLQKVYVVTQDIPANATSGQVAGSVEVAQLPTKSVAKGAVTDLAKIDGLLTTVPLVQGEQVLQSRFDKAGSQGDGSGSGVPEGLQQISVTLEPAAAGADTVDVGSRVGVMATVTTDDGVKTKMIAQDVLVTGKDSAAKIVTFAVDGKGATRIAAAVSQGGSIYLTSQNAKTDRDAGGALDGSAVIG